MLLGAQSWVNVSLITYVYTLTTAKQDLSIPASPLCPGDQLAISITDALYFHFIYNFTFYFTLNGFFFSHLILYHVV